MNYFKYCTDAPLSTEPAIALAFWPISKQDMYSYIQEKFPHLDKDIAEVYYDALEEQCEHDLNRK